jgi:DNA-directed RNA polymerase subunit RPC12/RpoP
MDDINNDNFDLFDQLSDDKLWDILDNITNEETDKKTIDVIIDKYNKTCSSCNTKILVFTSSRGSYVCENCGLESQEILDDGPEWSNYDDGKTDNSRCGAPINAFFPKSSLGTTINAPGYSKVKMLRNWGHVPYRE